MAIFAGLVIVEGQIVLWIAGAAVLVLLVVDDIRRWRARDLLREFHQVYGHDKDLLLVYTASPHWQPRIEQEWLPRWGARAVVFNRTDRWHSTDLRARLWRAYGGVIEHTPLAVVIPLHGPPKVVRFFTAFRDFKHGKRSRLERAEGALQTALDACRSANAA